MRLDTVLAVLGALFGLPGFLMLFFGPYPSAAVLMTVVGILLLVIAIALTWISRLPPYTCKKASVELTIHDAQGQRGTLSKQYAIRPNHHNLQSIKFRNIAADGVTNDIRWNDEPVPEANIRKILGEYEVTIQHQGPLRRWRAFEGKLSYSVIDSFLGNPEGLVYVPDFPTRIATIRINLPLGRPCLSTNTWRTTGAVDIPIADAKMLNNNTRIELELKRPKVGSEYNVFWNWPNV